ncbi:fatty acid synthase-like [Onthophagus taurus]|uniref:fatty acid synthase-like n=1 Tax=Onthophagus taurus TaxID=166361 RepID=UPI0039BE424F
MNLQEDIVISGIGGYFPKAHNIVEFKNNLYSNEILLGSRWKEGELGVCNKIGVITGAEHFDTAFFGIHRHQATYMDPMQRLMMERTFEALIDAGVNPQDIRGKKIGVFTASSIGENDNLFYESIVSGFGVTGHSRAMMSNRISYWLNLKGPSCAYDSNWIGGIEVLNLAVTAVQEGHCEAAIIGSANLALNAEISFLYNDMGLLSQDGSTKAFDKDASGYARADGVVVMLIQRASDAKRVYASVLHSATIFNGARDGPIFDQNLEGMTNFVDEFYEKCKINPADVEYVETYGCGVKRTDEIELNALESVYCKNRKSPLLIGSIKPQTGHSEASDNLFSIAKVLVAMENKKIPAMLQFKNPNPNIPGLLNGNLEVVTENRDWKGELAAVHGIGLCSSYAHVLLKGNPILKTPINNDLPKLVVASTRTENGIQEILKTLQEEKDIDDEYIGLTHNFFSKTVSGHLYRGYTILDESENPKHEFEHYTGNKRPIWFVYSGMGSQWVGMANDLMKLPIFAESIKKSAKILEPKGIDLISIVTGSDPKIFDSIVHSFVGIAAVQIALTDILKALGVVPDGIIGHSVGELGCSYADDCLTPEQMILCAYSRGRASVEVELVKGMMAAIGLGNGQVKDRLPESIEVACHNSTDNCTLSGPTEDMEKYVKELQDKGIFARLVNVANIAYHSRYIRPAAPKLLEYLKKIIPEPKARSSKWISTSVLEENWDGVDAKLCSAQYHTNNLLGSVLFEEGSKHIPKDAIAIEIAPHGLLQAILKRSLSSECTNIPLTQRGNKNGLQFLLSAIGKMYLAGIDVNIAAIYPEINYPVSRGTLSLTPLVHWEHSETWRTGIEDKINYLFNVKDTQITLNSDEYRYCNGHILDDNCTFPISSLLNILMEILISGSDTKPSTVIFENILFKNMLTIPKVDSIPLHALIQTGSGSFEILSGKTMIATGKIYVPHVADKFWAEEIEVVVPEKAMELTTKDVYCEFNHRGHKYSGDFKVIKSVKLGETGQISKVGWNNKWTSLFEGMLQQYILKRGEKYQNIITPSFIQKIAISLEKLPTNNEDIDVTYNYHTEIISTESIQIIGLQHNTQAQIAKPISLLSNNFVGLEKISTQSIDVAINYSVHTAINNFDINTKNIAIIDIETINSESFSENIKNVLDKNVEISGNVTKTKEDKIAILFLSTTNPILIVSSETPSENVLKTIVSSHAFALVKTDKTIYSNENIQIIFEFVINQINYCLIRKRCKVTPNVVVIKSDLVSSKDLSKDALNWVMELKEKSISKITYLIVPVLPTEGASNFISELKLKKEFNNVRCVFLEKNVNFDLNSNQGREIIRKDLSAVFFKNGKIGTYLPLPLDFMDDVKNLEPSSTASIAAKNVHFLGINANDETLTNEKHEIGLGNIDYSGVDAKDRIMGVAKMDVDTCNLIPDDILHWKIPEKWSMEDGCSIPHAYITAYYCLITKGYLEPGETVLIHNGTSSIGLASICLALNKSCKVFTTVATSEQRFYLKKRFPQLKDRNILSSKDSSFEANLLMATGGEGAHLILNTLSKSLLKASVRCVADYGRFIQLGKFDIAENSTIGMSVFLKNTSFGTVVPEDIFEASLEEKEELKKLIQGGIDEGIIKPIRREIVTHHDIRSILDSLIKYENIGKTIIRITPETAVNYLNISKPNQFICNPRCSYLIYGGSSESWTDMVEWLVFRGARKIAVCSDSKPLQNHVNRRLVLLRGYFGAEIIFTSKKIQTKENAAEVLTEINDMGPIQAVFVLPISSNKFSDLKSIQYVDMALRNIAPKAIFVNMVTNASGITQNRLQDSFNAYNIDWVTSLDFAFVLYGLDEILGLKTKDVIVRTEIVGDIPQETVQALYIKLVQMLPSSSQELEQIYLESPDKPTFTQVQTLGPCKIREVPPIFVIPGLFNPEILSKMCFPLLHPTFIANFSNSHLPLEEMAKILAKEIQQIYPRGPYNIVGVSWGGILALEISKILEQHKNTQITFVDGTPDIIKDVFNHLGDISNLQLNVISRLLNVTSADILKTMNNTSNLTERINLAMQNYSGGNKENIRKSLILLLERIKMALGYLPSENLFKGGVYLIRPTGSNKNDKCGLTKYVEKAVNISILNGNHLTLLENELVADTINEYIAIR